MEKLSKTQLPEEAIQHIQSFLNAKEAARTTLLSTSWYTAWLTRPNLDFSDVDIPMFSAFERLAKKTMQRYDELNRKIQSFRLSMYTALCNAWYKGFLANELTRKALKLGATDLDIDLSRSPIDFQWFLPHEVLESETLVRLSLFKCRIDLRRVQKVSCWNLKSLNLRRVCIEGNSIWDIILMCPLIEELVLSECLSCNYNVSIFGRFLELNPDVQYDFRKLRVLLLGKVKIGEWFFYDISRFPCLKELILHNCTGYEEIQICSNSLECISFLSTDLSILRFKFDVPRIRKFKFSGCCVPSLSFKTTSREWESDIFIKCVLNFHVLKTSWFHELRELLSELSPSKIYLSLQMIIYPPFLKNRISLDEGHDYHQDISSLQKPSVVEKLMLDIYAPTQSSVRSAVLTEFFCCCRPNLITLCWLPSDPEYHNMSRGNHERITEMILECATRIGYADWTTLRSEKDHVVESAFNAIGLLEKMVSKIGDYFQRVGAYILEGFMIKIKNMGYAVEGLNTFEISPLDLTFSNSIVHQLFPNTKLSRMFTNTIIGEAMSAEERIHIIDMRIGQGTQWIPFIQGLSLGRRLLPPYLRITGLDESAGGGGLDQVGQALAKVAEGYSIPFEFKANVVEIRAGEAVAVNMVNLMSTCVDENHRNEVLLKVKKWSPKVVTLVEQESESIEGHIDEQCSKTLDYYSAVFDSIEAAGLSVKERGKVEHCIGGEIVNTVSCEGKQRLQKHELFRKWEKLFAANGFSIIQPGQALHMGMLSIVGEYGEHYSISQGYTGALFVRWKYKNLTSHSAWTIS
ncbi:hypothetical protein ACS0TY_028077 [Phlomoides rotata]